MITTTPLTVADFSQFFTAVTGHRPFAWQQRLLDQLMATGIWPTRISAPTGAGKTSVIDVHAFAVALNLAGVAERVPRRLAMVVDRRVLVDDQYLHAQELNRRLVEAEDDTVLKQVESLLSRLRKPAPGAPADPLLVARLRGGEPPSTQWRHEPDACAIICATPDMWGSRALLRGYGSRRTAWPIEAGLLTMDCAVVVDEAHLSRQLIATARRVATLQERDEPLNVPRLQCVETTATPSGSGSGEETDVGVTASDLALDAVLAQRLNAPKELRTVAHPAWPPSKRTDASVITSLVELTLGLVDEVGDAEGPATVGCFVNTVRTAMAVYEQLGRRGLTAGKDLAVVCGRMRRRDLERIRRLHPGLLSIEGSSEVRVLVTTQSLEVGVDIDLAAAVSELAPATALAQRAGRVNRLGRRAASAFTVLVPDGVVEPASTGYSIASTPKRSSKDGRIGPYLPTDVAAAQEWLSRLIEGRSIAPNVVRESSPPAPSVRLLHRLERWDGWHLANTSVPCSAEPDLEVWLADDLTDDLDVGIVVRRGLNGDAADLTYLRATQIHPGEVYPTPIGVARRVIEKLLADGGSSPLYRLVEDRNPERLIGPTIRPGDTIVIGERAPAFAGVGDVMIVDGDGRLQGSDVLEEAARDERMLDVRLGSQFPAGATVATEDLARILDQCRTSDPNRRDGRTALGARLTDTFSTSDTPVATDLVELGRRLGNTPLTSFDVTLIATPTEDDQDAMWVAITDRRRRQPDDQVELVAGDSGPVPLDVHLRDVAERAAYTATSLGLPAAVVDVMRAAGQWHDLGKGDPRFQTLLEAADTPLAKSGDRSVGAVRAALATCGLPRHWRHEQRSLPDCGTLPDRDATDLARRLVGTHHGHGRPLFPHDSSGLSPVEVAGAHELFDEGSWNAVLDRTRSRLGVWGCAYLEAVFRSADVQASREKPVKDGSPMMPAPSFAPPRATDRSAFTIRLSACAPEILASHLALFGLGAVLQEAFGDDAVRVVWTASMDPRPEVTILGDVDWPAVHDAVTAHLSSARVWLDQDFPDAKGRSRGLMSPRRDIAPDRLQAFLTKRHEVMDQVDVGGSEIQARMLGGLGEPSHWHRNRQGERQPDLGASRFDTQPRNSGSELVANRLRKLAAAVTKLDVAGLEAELTTPVPRVDDPTACAGLAPGNTFGSALAWFAHWGMSVCPVAPRTIGGRRSLTTTFSDDPSVPPMCSLVMPTSPMRVSRLRDILGAEHAVVMLERRPSSTTAASRGWLLEHGVRCVATFTFHNRGSASAARWVADLGRLVPTDG